jgi:amidohydrolase
MLPTLRRVAGEDRVRVTEPTTTAEDFSYYQCEIPGLFFFRGVRLDNIAAQDAASNQSPRFLWLRERCRWV